MNYTIILRGYEVEKGKINLQTPPRIGEYIIHENESYIVDAIVHSESETKLYVKPKVFTNDYYNDDYLNGITIEND